VYDVVCPVCQSMIEISARAVESKGSHRCPKCWAWLKVVDSHPLRVERGEEGKMVASSRIRARHLEDEPEEDED